MELTKFMTVCLVLIFICKFVYGTKQELEPLVRHRRGPEPTKAPLKLITLLPVINVNQPEVKALPNNLNVKVYNTEPSNLTKGVTIRPVLKKIGTTLTTPLFILYTTRKPMSTKPMVTFKNNNEIVTKAPEVEIEQIENNDTISGQTHNNINHDIIKTTAQPNADSKNACQTIYLEEHTQDHLNNDHEDHISKAGTEKQEEIQHTTYHVSDKNGKKITEITTTKIIEENSNNAASNQLRNEKCDILDLTDEYSSKIHSSEKQVKNKSVIAINKTPNGTIASKNLGLKNDLLESLTTNHIDEHSHEMETNVSLEDTLDIKQKHKNHDIDCDIKNQTTHLLEVTLECTKPLDNKNTDDVKGCNITQQLEKKENGTHLPQAQSVSVDHKDNPNITIKLLLETPKVDVIKLVNVSSMDLKSVRNTTMKPVATDLSIDTAKEVTKLPTVQKINTLLLCNALKPQVTIAPTRSVVQIVNMTDSNATRVSNDKKLKDLEIQRMKMSIKVEMNSNNKSVPVDSKDLLTSVVHNENGLNSTYTNVDSKRDGKKNDTKETITIHRNNIEEIVDCYKYPSSNNFYDNLPYNTNENYIANNNYLANFQNLGALSMTTSTNNVVEDCNNYVVNGNYVPENNVKYFDNYAANTANNNYDNYQQVSNHYANHKGNLNEQKPNNFYSNYINGQYYPTYQNIMPSASSIQNYQNNVQTDNVYLNPNAYYLQNYKPNTHRADNLYYNTYNPEKYNYVNNLNFNRNNPTKFYNYKEHYLPGKYHDRIWRTWNNMDITVSNKGTPLKIEFGKDDKNTIQLYNTIRNNSNPYINNKHQERPYRERSEKLILPLL